MSKSIAELFIQEAIKTESKNFDEITLRLIEPRTIRLLHSSMGLITEGAEFLDALKKYIFYGKELDLVNLKEELGDLNWYEAIAHHELGTSFEEVMVLVIQKLRRRYHNNNFSSEAATNRNLEGERNELEKAIDLATGFGMGANKLTEQLKAKLEDVIHYGTMAHRPFLCGIENGEWTPNIDQVTCEDCLRGAKVNYGK